MINIEHVIAQRVVSHFFFSYILVEITHATYQGLSEMRLSKEYVGRKVNNTAGFKFRRNFAFSFSP